MERGRVRKELGGGKEYLWQLDVFGCILYT